MKVLITHPVSAKTLSAFTKKEDSSITQASFAKLQILISQDKSLELYCIPQISGLQTSESASDASIQLLSEALVYFQPQVLIVGHNSVPAEAILSWREAMQDNQQLLIIRRGVDIRAIDQTAAKAQNVKIKNLPGVNSPFVAEHMLAALQLNKAKPGEKIAIIGVGNIGKCIAIEAIKRKLDTVLFSPSLADPKTRENALIARGIIGSNITCAQTLEEAVDNAKYLAISIPWLDEKTNAENRDLLTYNQIKLLADNARVSSVSVPRVFSETALELLNTFCAEKKAYVQIDTPLRYILTMLKNYPHIVAYHDKAFATNACQEALDEAMFAIVNKFQS